MKKPPSVSGIVAVASRPVRDAALLRKAEPPCPVKGSQMGSSLNPGPFLGLVYKGTVLFWGPRKGPDLENYPNVFSLFVTLTNPNHIEKRICV